MLIPTNGAGAVALGGEGQLEVRFGTVGGVDSALAALEGTGAEAQGTAHVAAHAEAVGGAAELAVRTDCHAVEAGVAEEGASPAAASRGAIIGSAGAGDAVGGAVGALVAEGGRNELPVGTEVVAGALIGPLVVRSGGVEVVAAQAVMVGGVETCGTACRAVLASHIAGLAELGAGTVLHTGVAREEHQGTGCHAASEAVAGVRGAGLAAGVAEQADLVGGVGELAVGAAVVAGCGAANEEEPSVASLAVIHCGS